MAGPFGEWNMETTATVPETETEDRTVSVDKASGAFADVVAWLLKPRTFEEKLAAVAVGIFCCNGAENKLPYDGEIGTDLEMQWEDEVFAVLRDPEKRSKLDRETLCVASYIEAVNAMND
jgi:hypothetical protein